MELKMKLWTTSGQCRVRWTDHDYPKALFRRVDPSHFTNNDVYQVLSSQLGEWSTTNVCQDHSLVYVMQSFDFSIAQRGDQEVSANGMSATVGQVQALLAYFGMKETDLNFWSEDEEATVVERRTELYSMLLEVLKRDDGLFALSSSSLAQIGLRWLAFIIPVKLWDQFVPEQGASVKSPIRLGFELKLSLLIAKYLPVASQLQRAKYTSLKAKDLKEMKITLNRVDSIRRGRNYIMKSEINRIAEYLSEAKLLDNKKNMIQESSPEVADSPCHGDDDMKACTRFTIIRKLRMFQKFAVVIGDVQSMVSFGSHIDVPAPQPIVEEDLRSITLVTSRQVQIKDNLSFINQFAGPTVTPAVLMKAHALMARETIKEVTETVLEPCQKIFETFFTPERQRNLADCVNCHDGDELHLRMCSRELRSFHDWNEGLRTTIHDATLFEESEALDNLTEPIEVSLVTSLATLSMLASAKVVKEMTTDRKVYALSAENF